MPLVEDLSSFFAVDEHGTSVLIDAEEVIGILNAGYHEISGMASTQPTFLCAEADVADVEPDVSELVGGVVTYTVRSVEPDGSGIALLRLERAA